MYYKNKVVTSSALIRPKSLEVTPTAVFIRTNIEEFAEIIEEEEEERQGWRYDESKYSKDDYIKLLTRQDESQGQDIIDVELEAMKQGQELTDLELRLLLLEVR